MDVLHDPTFAFRYGDGSGWMAYNVLSVDAQGHCTFIFLAGQSNGVQQWKRATFDCDGPTLSGLRQLLVDMKVTEMPRCYEDVSVADGHQRVLHLFLSGYEKRVDWSNYFPPSCEQFDAYVQGRILGVQGNAIGGALPATQPGLE